MLTKTSAKIGKKGQHEIAGFVLIVVMVVIISLIFLAISLKKTQEMHESEVVSNFLDASLAITTDCAINYLPNYQTLSKLIRACYTGKICVDGRDSCDVMNKTFEELLRNSWTVGKESYIKGYILKIYTNESGNPETITSFYTGNCTTGKKSGALRIIPSSGGRDIIIMMEICTEQE